MTRILFVCHGNICRSPMAEFVFREMAEKRGMGALFHAASAATSGEELGNPVHQGTREKLQAVGISCADKRAVRLRPDDYRAWDLLLGMDSYNLSNMRRIFGGDPERRMYRLLDYSAHPRDIADPCRCVRGMRGAAGASAARRAAAGIALREKTENKRPGAARTEFRSGGARPFVYFVRQAQASPSSMPRTTAISCAAAPACSRYDSAVP